MKKLYFIQILALLISNNIFSQYSLDIEISGIRNNAGKIMLQLLDKDKIIIKQEMNPVKGRECSFSFKDLNPGFYAVRYYHDENQNGKMETNLVGKPTEGYGFSNNVTGKFGAPPFEKWLFELKKDQTIRLEITY